MEQIPSYLQSESRKLAQGNTQNMNGLNQDLDISNRQPVHREHLQSQMLKFTSPSPNSSGASSANRPTPAFQQLPPSHNKNASASPCSFIPQIQEVSGPSTEQVPQNELHLNQEQPNTSQIQQENE